MVGKFLQKTIVFLSCCLPFFQANAQTSGTPATLVTGDGKGCAPLEVKFVPHSTKAKSYYWDFGNGSSSTLIKPAAIYLKKGTYTAMLIETDALGKADTFYQSNAVEVLEKPVSDFNFTRADECQGSVFKFSNSSKNNTSNFWDFGDGYSSTEREPSHTYTTSGTYTIKLLVANDFGCKEVLEKKVSVVAPAKPKAAFTVNAQTSCDKSFAFNFTSTDANASQWFWDFGDGKIASVKNPSHKYNKAGAYKITHVTYNSFNCSDTLAKDSFILIEENLIPVFTINNISSCVGSSIKLTYTGPAMAKFLWDLGNGKTSTSKNPVFSYAGTGSYTIKLQATTKAGCVYNYTYPDPVVIKSTTLKASFTGSAQGCGEQTVSFTNTSVNAKSYLWDFGDKTTSTDKNPTHTFTKPGKYDVKLTATSSAGDCDQDFISKAAVEIFPEPIALFQSKNRGGCPPYKCLLENTSTNGDTYLWNFGDGTTSTDKSPEHIYSKEGKYSITLTAVSAKGCVKTVTLADYVDVKNLTTNFVSPPAVKVCAPYTTSFAYAGINSSEWNWDFGDGTTSIEQNPKHTYTSPGKYVVSLKTVTSEGCTQTISNFQTIIIEKIEANFSYQRKSDCPPYEYYFKDLSTNAVSWLWNFGDGTTSTDKNPTHNFASSGDYNVTLTSTNASGCTSVMKMKVSTPVFIASPSKAYSNMDFKFPLTVSFKANSKGATSWFWDFDDNGATSTKENPSYTYKDSNTYYVTLIISDGKCSLKYLIVIKPPIPPVPANSDSTDYDASVLSGCVPLWVDFTSKFKSSNSTFRWDFGDGDTSLEQNPVHVFSKPGFYKVTYTITNTKTKKSTTATKYVNVLQPEAKFVMTQNISDKEIMVAFTDSSKKAFSWFWEFGDGKTSTDKNPLHIYKTEDKYLTVKLTIKDTSDCYSTTSQVIYVGESYPIKVNSLSLCKQDPFIMTCTYTKFKKYSYSFGDGNVTNTDTCQASHIYKSAGKYLPNLTITDSYGRNYAYVLKDSVNIYSPKAAFTVSGENVACNMVTLKFQNTSVGASKYLWHFSDGTTSTEKNPTHTFLKTGKINAALTVTGANCKDSIMNLNIGEVLAAKPDFTFKQNGTCFPITVQYKDASKDAVSWAWDFGDGITSTEKNPSHIFYALPKNQTSLKITDIRGCSGTIQKLGVDKLDAKFKATNAKGCGPLSVTFMATDTQATFFFWNFGDGTTSIEKKPTHIYTTDGKYTVSLRVGTSPTCTDSVTVKDVVSVSRPVADFMSPEVSSCAPAAVTFVDKSIDAANWFWDFGDGSTSELQNPAHIYSIPGRYDVSLVIRNKTGCADSVIKKKYILIRGPISKFAPSSKRGCMPFTVNFSDLSKNAVSWNWNFGNGNTSSQQNPEYTYTAPGKYFVTLITKDSTGCESSYTFGEPLIVDDTFPPVISPILAVSVVSDKAISIQWTPNKDDDFKAYILYRENASGAYMPIYKVEDNSVINFTDVDVNTTNTVYMYKLQTIDRCGNAASLNSLVAHGNINIEAKPLAAAITVNWTPYVGCDVNTYSLYRQQGNAAPQLIATLNGTTLNYVDSTFSCPVKYTYRVVASDLCGNAVVSWSDVSTALPNNVIAEQKTPVIRTTVLAEINQTLTEWKPVDHLNKIVAYNVLRSTDGGQYELYTTLSKLATDFIDNKVDVNAHTYQYRVMPTNECDITVAPSAFGNSILLQGEAVDPSTLSLNWNKYEGWQEGVDHYILEKKDIDGNWQIIATVPGNTNTFLDKEK
ncbi:MAG: PKD domain-containing protein [Sphingobacteriales bacterium]|nr:MAG: PKD domain-containing protein [Sphingobacteriales bacterium]